MPTNSRVTVSVVDVSLQTTSNTSISVTPATSHRQQPSPRVRARYRQHPSITNQRYNTH
ncbi:hypothetical protein GZ137_13795, partial [Staphylococcus aureus]|nr:hypothetical protein [Staphylococcus aureus]